MSILEQIFYFPSTMIWPLAACLVLTGIHVYLGVHVIARKVIFVDLALAQIAALGTVIGVLFGYEVGKDTTALYLYSLVFTIFGAFVFSVTRMKGEKVPHEAIIGIVYAVTFAGTILVLSQSALGPQELEHIIKGELLWVQSDVVTGPTPLPDEVLHALMRQPMDMGDPRVDETIAACEVSLKQILQTTASDVFFYACNGHGAWEAAVENLVPPGGTVLVPGTGHFSESWAVQTEALGRRVLRTPWIEGLPIDAAAVTAALRQDTQHQIVAVFVVHTDTSSGITSDVPAQPAWMLARSPNGTTSAESLPS